MAATSNIIKKKYPYLIFTIWASVGSWYAVTPVVRRGAEAVHTSHGHSSTELMNWDVVVPQSFGILTLKKAEVESVTVLSIQTLRNLYFDFWLLSLFLS